jgi:hypothetical protein
MSCVEVDHLERAAVAGVRHLRSRHSTIGDHNVSGAVTFTKPLIGPPGPASVVMRIAP